MYTSYLQLNSSIELLLQRKAGELDDEILQITGKVLQENPDIYTLWNVRKETILLIKKEKYVFIDY